MFDLEITNEMRAKKARTVLAAHYMADTEGLQTALADLLADAMHMASETALGAGVGLQMFEAALEMARSHHATERAEEAKEI